jgi:MFS transporter, DHA2 family, integral membrane protein
VVGSVMLSTYGARVGNALTASKLAVPPDIISQAKQSLATALGIATDKRVSAGLQTKLVTEINNAFVSGMHRGVLFAAAATLLGAIIVFRWLPARGTEVDGIPAATSPEELAPSAQPAADAALEPEPA